MSKEKWQEVRLVVLSTILYGIVIYYMLDAALLH